MTLVVITSGDDFLAIRSEENGLFQRSRQYSSISILEDNTHMLKLRDVRPGDVDEWSIRVNDSMRDKRSHAKMVILRPSPLKRTS